MNTVGKLTLLVAAVLALGACDTARDAVMPAAHAEKTPQTEVSERGGDAWWHPGRHGKICLGPKKVLGIFGELHPKVLAAANAPAALAPYLEVVRAMNKGELLHYPGSPFLTRALLRDHDRLFLTELHPADMALLEQLFARDRQVRVEKADAYETLVAKMPPKEKRGLVVIDPPYELKEDYQAVVHAISDAHRRFATGTYVLWYPVVERARVEAMMAAFKATGIKKQLRIEQGLLPDTDQHGMTSAGLFDMSLDMRSRLGTAGNFREPVLADVELPRRPATGHMANAE